LGPEDLPDIIEDLMELAHWRGFDKVLADFERCHIFILKLRIKNN
jgi:hypothetical protein